MVKIHNKEKLLKFLLSNKKEQFTIRALAKAVALDYKIAYLTVQELRENKTLETKKIGQTVLCALNLKQFNPDIFRAESSRTADLLKNKNFTALYSYFSDIQEPFFVLLLFGSWASGKSRKESDIDLMLLADDEKAKKEVENRLSLIPLKIHLVAFSSSEFLSMLKTNEFNVGKEAFYNNRILFGIEDYYRLIHHA